MSNVDPYRANRELERWLRNGVPEDQYRPRGLPADWMDRATVIGTITYNMETGDVTYEYADDEQTGEAK